MGTESIGDGSQGRNTLLLFRPRVCSSWSQRRHSEAEGWTSEIWEQVAQTPKMEADPDVMQCRYQRARKMGMLNFRARK